MRSLKGQSDIAIRLLEEQGGREEEGGSRGKGGSGGKGGEMTQTLYAHMNKRN
jgi:hypothetical protein